MKKHSSMRNVGAAYPSASSGQVMRSSQKNGYTLVETMITCAIFLIVLTILSFVLVTNFRFFKSGEAEVYQIKSLRKSLSYICQTLREATVIRNEDALKTTAGSSEIIFDFSDTGKVCSFKYNGSAKGIEYFEYENYGDPQRQKVIPESVRSVSLKTENIKLLNFKIEDYLNSPRLITVEETADPATAKGSVFTVKAKVLIY